jgi:hypothetical protein
MTDELIYQVMLVGPARETMLGIFGGENPAFYKFLERLIHGAERCLTCQKAFPDVDDAAYENPGGYVLMDPGRGQGRGYAVCEFCWQAEDDELQAVVAKALSEIEPDTKVWLTDRQ